MYKELKKHIQKDIKEESTLPTMSHEQTLKVMSELLLTKAEQHSQASQESLEKGFRRAASTGLSVLGLIQGAHVMGQPDTQEKAPRAIERNVASQKSNGPRSEIIKPSNRSPEGSLKSKNIKGFLQAISMNESSGGKNMNHKQMRHGIHAGDSAIGSYGLMPNTVKETVGRMGKNHPLNRKYSNMPNEQIGASLQNNPKHGQEIATHLANRLHDKFGGDESKMSYSWNQGSNLTNDHFKEGGGHSDYKNHEYVQKYHKNRSQVEKTPQKTQKSFEKPSQPVDKPSF